ncbi:Monocarboxylate Transporter 13 [Manis pentadactyla]|nr:Monocarboxylate Transporter 13 [Manis pentadactyla]
MLTLHFLSSYFNLGIHSVDPLCQGSTFGLFFSWFIHHASWRRKRRFQENTEEFKSEKIEMMDKKYSKGNKTSYLEKKQ